MKTQYDGLPKELREEWKSKEIYGVSKDTVDKIKEINTIADEGERREELLKLAKQLEDNADSREQTATEESSIDYNELIDFNRENR